MQHDELWIRTMLEGKARWVAVRTTDTVEEARRRHGMSQKIIMWLEQRGF